jgi:hypothetical protein
MICPGVQAREHPLAVHVHSACTALTLVASFLRAGQVKMFTQRIQ